jgi:hypothetical protein
MTEANLRFRYLFALHIRQAHRQVIDVRDLVSTLKLDMDRISVDANIDRSLYESLLGSLDQILQSGSEILRTMENDLFSNTNHGVPAPSEVLPDPSEKHGPWILRRQALTDNDDIYWTGESWGSASEAKKFDDYDLVDEIHEVLWRGDLRCYIVPFADLQQTTKVDDSTDP